MSLYIQKLLKIARISYSLNLANLIYILLQQFSSILNNCVFLVFNIRQVFSIELWCYWWKSNRRV